MRNRANDVLDVIDRIRNTSILGYALICKVNLAFRINSNVFEKCVAVNCVVDVRFCILVKIDNLCIATAFEVKHAVVVPSVFVVADKLTFRIGRKSCLTCS